MELEDGTCVGTLCFKGLDEDGIVELGYGVEPSYEGRGYATEAVSAIAKWASTQEGVKRVEAETEPSNVARSGCSLSLALFPVVSWEKKAPALYG